MAVGDVVTILVEYCQDGAETFRAHHGPERTTAVRDLIDLLKRELGSQLEFDALWAEFRASPRETEADLRGALEALIEADPGLADRLGALMEEYYAGGGSSDVVTDVDVLQTETSGAGDWRKRLIPNRQIGLERHTDDAGDGVYLYGNVRAGDVSLEGGPELGELAESNWDKQGLSVGLTELFEQLQATAERRQSLSDAVRRRLHDELEGLEAEILLGDEASEDRIVEHLRGVADLDLDFLGLLLTGMQHIGGRGQAAVDPAIDQAAQWLEEG